MDYKSNAEYMEKITSLKARRATRGFTLPIVSAIVGFITAMGSAIFPTFFHNVKQNGAPIGEVATSTATSNAPSAPVSARVATSSQPASPVAKAKTKSPVTQITATSNTSVEKPVTEEVVNTSAPSVQTEVPVNPYKTSLEAIDAFLANPTIASLKVFCMKAEQLPGRGTYEGLDSNRTNMIQYTNTLYADVKWCRYVLNEGYDPKFGHFTFMYYDPSFLLPLTNSSDSDATRKLQIRYNQAVQAVGQYGLIGYESDMAEGPDPGGNKRPDVVMTTILAISNGSRAKSIYPNSFISTIMAPVEALTKLRQEYMSN